MTENLYLIPLLPLIGFLINGIWGRKLGEKNVGLIATSVLGIAFVMSLIVFFDLLALDPHHRVIEVNYFTWMSVGNLNIPFGMLLDPLSGVMILVVTGVSFLIHIYSIGYIHGDPGATRYFSYLNLFVFFMLILVLGNSYPIMFIGWEGVGLCSYLLIGFWFTDDQKASAGKKAFVVNRIGDFGFLIGMFMIFSTFGAMTFTDVAKEASFFTGSSGVMFWMTLCLFIGATGKSAQIPLFVWLPDAMAGPTPVSALIHAATMVTAGVYMVARNSFLFALAPGTLQIVAWIGVLTAIFAASIALVQNDIKKVLAYSTVSQLGYMFVGCGVGAYAAGVSHLVTHAFFKALLFLGAGAVIHSVHHAQKHAGFEGDPQDIRFMGGLKKKLPITYLTFVIACFAIAGFPGLSGFFSKDEIIWMAFANGHTAIGVVAMIAAGMTAFYMFRLLYMTFYGEWRGRRDQEDHLKESPKSMTYPLIVLAFMSVVAGWIMIPKALGGGMQFEHFLHPVFEFANSLGDHGHHSISAEYTVMAISILIAIGGILLARSWYYKKSDIPAQLAARMKLTHKTLMNKYWVDEIYDFAVVQVVMAFGEVAWKFFDVKIVDGIVNGAGKLFDGLGSVVRRVQTGMVAHYALMMTLSIVFILGYMVWK
jgi:NADH-quinone oxidoreductase subunit L